MKGYESEGRYVDVGVLGGFSRQGEGLLMIDDHIATRKCRQVLDLFKVIWLLEFNRTVLVFSKLEACDNFMQDVDDNQFNLY